MKDIVSIYRDLHKIPELSNKEYKTKQYIKVLLEKLKGEIIEVGNTCILFYCDFNKKDTIAFRSDMDGLPIEEQNKFDYASTNKGIMHACGHDGHMSILLKLCEYVSNLKNCRYNILCIFQEGEENLTGAKLVLGSNVLKKKNTKYIFGLHLWPGLEKGKIYSKQGPLLASAHEIDILVKGKQAHICNKESGLDSIEMANEILNRIYKYEKKEHNHLLHFGKISGGCIRNVISGETKIEGTMRVFLNRDFKKISRFLHKTIDIVKKEYKGEVELIFLNSSDCVVNDEIVGKFGFANKLDTQFFQGEDFGFYCKDYRCVFFLLGTGSSPMLHSCDFHFDESILNDGYECFKNVIKLI